MNNIIQPFLKNLIQTVPDYHITEEEKKTIRFEGIEQYIFNKLSSAKYRSSSMPDDLKEYVREKIKYCIDNELPIHCSFPFGAYKLWKLPTQPFPDWAEVFNIVQLREYLAPIAKAYKHAVILRYYSVELFVERNNHIPQSDLDKYQEQFSEILKYFRKHLPNNFRLEFTNLREEVSQEEALAAIDKKVKKLKKEWKNVSKAEKELKIKRAKVNCKVDPNDPNYDEIIKEAVYVHDAFSSGCWKNENTPWAFDKDMIPLGHSYTGSWGIHVKSSQSSRVNFWVGTGVLQDKVNEFLPTILSHKQYEVQKDKIKHIPVEIFDNKFTNLKEVPIISLT